MALEEILSGLNAEQLEAVKTLNNVVVSAGAGSGKTKVLASRFAYLIIEKGVKVDEILTLTFTNKATNEMYSRIYRLLSAQTDEAAQAAAKDFHKAKIQTLDSFCAEICALASTRYGIKNDFTTDEAAVCSMACDAALSFVLDNRASAGINALITDNKIRDIARGLFAEIVIKYGSITNPLPFEDYIRKQRDELSEKWNLYAERAGEIITLIKNELPAVENTNTATYKNFCAVFNGQLNAPPSSIEGLFENDSDFTEAESVRSFIETLSIINNLRKVGNVRNMDMIREVHDDFKDNIYPQLVKIASMMLQFDTARGIFSLLDKFQRDFNNKKRVSGIMTFNDAAELALTILKNEADIRNIYREKIKYIMIDEFQDNNELQREMLFLLGDNNIFFVGDQKQSIYRFRGADVSVFKKLSGEIENRIGLKINYRSGGHLINSFNGIFGEIFLKKDVDIPDFEAEYEPLASPEGTVLAEKNVRICLFDKTELAPDAECAAEDIEAAFAAEYIRRMVNGAYQVWDRDAGKLRHCSYSDFAVLERSVSHQHNLEKQFRSFGVPYNSENFAGLFIDAPANDIYNFLRLLVYPKDKSAYAAVLRSPFARLSDLTLTICMLNFTGTPFDISIESLPEADRPLYKRAGNIYHELQRGIREQNLTSAELVTKLWYDYAYRYDTLWSEEAQVYSEIYDYLFELARINDAYGKTPAGFIDHLEAISSKTEKPPDFDLPLERRQGVKIMTIHKSKGLEFPIVFIYGIGGHGQNVKNSGFASYSDDWGVSLNLGTPENFPAESTGNYFFELTRNIEKQKEEAELRRLLYVAMTRAEDTLVLTGIKNTKNTGVKSFLDLLEPAMEKNELQFFSSEIITARTRAEIRAAASVYNAGAKEKPMREKAESAAEKYARAGEAAGHKIFITRKQASRRRDDAGKNAQISQPPALPAAGAVTAIEEAALTPLEFGTLVHRIIEERYNSFDETAAAESLTAPVSAAANDEKLAAAEKLAAVYAERFFDSDIGKKSLHASFRKTEYSFLSLYEEDGRKIYVSGAIDLLFEFENEMYIVDYKTDKIIDPEDHRGQISDYSKAVENIFSKKPRAYLFYLREGKLIEM